MSLARLLLAAGGMQVVAGAVLLAMPAWFDLERAATSAGGPILSHAAGSPSPATTTDGGMPRHKGPPPLPLPAMVPPIEPVRVRIPTIFVDLGVEPSVIEEGFFSVPWAALGHHAGSVTPGRPGNAVLVGHVLHLPLGRVATGDPVELVAADDRVARWRVVAIRTVPGHETAFIEADHGGPVRLTLYTCEGAYDWRTGEYSHRRVVVAVPEE